MTNRAKPKSNITTVMQIASFQYNNRLIANSIPPDFGNKPGQVYEMFKAP